MNFKFSIEILNSEFMIRINENPSGIILATYFTVTFVAIFPRIRFDLSSKF